MARYLSLILESTAPKMRPSTRLAMVGGDGLATLLIATLMIPATLGIGYLLMLWRVVGEARHAPHAPSNRGVVVVLGMRLVNGALSDDYRLRLERARTLQQEREDGIVILGGITDGGSVSEAARGRDYLIHHGIAEAAITIEDASRHTLENLHHARRLLPQDDSAILLISNRYHLARVAALATGLGINFRLCAAEEQLQLSLARLPRLLVEAFYLHWYWVGRGWSRLIRNRRSLARIS